MQVAIFLDNGCSWVLGQKFRCILLKQKTRLVINRNRTNHFYCKFSSLKVATFQIVLVTDFETSYVLYLYGEFHFNKLLSSPTIGHSATDYVTYYNVELNSSDLYLHMDEQTGNTGAIGQWMFNISHQNVVDEDELSCIQWSRDQQPADWVDSLLSCPCTRQQATQDWRYSFEHSQRTDCAIFMPSATQSTVECCYDSQDALISSSKKGSGGYVRYHPVFYPEAYLTNDKDPYVYCCEDSSNCETFRIYRPLADCKTYSAPATGIYIKINKNVVVIICIC